MKGGDSVPAFVPSSAVALYEKMHTWDALRGRLLYDTETERITWILAEDLRLEISFFDAEGTVEVFDSAQAKRLSLTHWHPPAETIYEEMLLINKGNIRFAYINTLFGKEMVYIGPLTGRKRHRFHLLHYLGEKLT